MHAASVGGTRQAQLAPRVGAEQPTGQPPLIDKCLLTGLQSVAVKRRAAQALTQIGRLVHAHPLGKYRLPHGVQQEGRLAVDRTAGNSAKQVSNQTGGLVRGEQHRHLGGFHRTWLQARERALGRLAPHRLLAGQPLGYTIYGVPVVALHALFRGGNKNGCATVPAAQRTADKTMAVAVHPAALLGADLRTVADQTRVNIQCGGLQQQRALDGIISAQLPGVKQIQIRQVGGHQLRIRKAGARVFTGVTGNHQRGLHRFDNGLIRGV